MSIKRRRLLGSASGGNPPTLTVRFWELWKEFWFQPGSPYPLAAFRICFGTYLLGYWISHAPVVLAAFSNEGITIPYLIPDWSLPPGACMTVFGAFLVVLGAWTSGLATGFLTPVILVLYLYFYFLGVAVRNTAYDRLNLIFLVLLCFGKLDGAWGWTWSRGRVVGLPVVPVSVWTQKMIGMQLCFLYFGAGLWKFTSRHWHTGDMMYFTMIGPWGTPLAFWIAQLGLPKWAWAVGTWSVVMWELAMPLLLLHKPFRRFGVLLGLGFHVAVGATLHIWEFLNCVAAYAVFADAEWLRRTGCAIARRCLQFKGILGKGA